MRDPRVVLRRWWFITSLRVQERLRKATLHLDVHPNVFIGPRVRVTLDPGTTNRLEIARGCRINDDVTIKLRGGTIRMGERSRVRVGSVLNVSGELELAGNNIISYYNVIHCADRIRFGRYASTNEFVTVVDSRHFHDDEADEFFYQNVESGPIDIGENVWIANKASVLMGVTIGDEAIVAAHALVHKDVPPKTVVAGLPARVIKER